MATAFGVCFVLNLTAFLKSSPLSEHSHVLSCWVPFPKGSGGVLPLEYLLQAALVLDLGPLET